jgi:hypothetical protein
MSIKVCLVAGVLLLGVMSANPFGVMSQGGTLAIEGAPEPGGMVLFGIGLLGLARQLRRIWQPSQD